MEGEVDRAVLFIDGNNWYHSLSGLRIQNLGDLDYALISKKLVGPRHWVETRYYIGGLKHYHRDFAAQRRFLSTIANDDDRITVHRGRIEDQPKPNALAGELVHLLRRAGHTLPPAVKSELEDMASRHAHVSFLKEKATDVLLAVDLCKLATEDRYDAAYLLSADGDYTPAVRFVQDEAEKKVYAASPADCAALRNTAYAYIPLRADWFGDCYRTR
ncbi:MAG TPA: NYN domain-containing protein [Thermoanaerobaculia bacterium]|nr:NYN domain-containing protein [Thermoanaerobaculia bacterium]